MNTIRRLVAKFPALRRVAKKIRAKFYPTSEIRDLESIVSTCLSKNLAFSGRKAAAHEIEGMFSDFSMAVIDSLLSRQEEVGVRGNLLELGVYKGRSAALIGAHLRAGERIILVDVEPYLDKRAVHPFRASVDFVVTDTKNFPAAYSRYSEISRGCRFIHIDASHSYRPTFFELGLADKLLADGGIICMDDFTNLNYSQNIAAIFKYLYTTKTDLRMFLVTDEKAYLCHAKDVSGHEAFVLNHLIPEMRSRGVEDICLARTDTDAEYSAFYARQMIDGETDRFYGLGIYRQMYQ